MTQPSDLAFWATSAADYLRPLFAAAILVEAGAREVADWLNSGDFTAPERILRAHGLDVHANRLADFSTEPAAAASAIRFTMLAAVSR
jgi:hypothetical protein